MNELKNLESLGLTLPSIEYIVGSIIFGILGYAAYRYGKRVSNREVRWIGVGLMLYPYLISETWLLYVVGTALCAGVYFYRRKA